MQLNMALFEFNGRTGYLLKHDVMRRNDKKFDPFCDRIDTVVASTLTIKAGSRPCYYRVSLSLTISVGSYYLWKLNVRVIDFQAPSFISASFLAFPAETLMKN